MIDEEVLSSLRAIDDELERYVVEGETLDLHLLERAALVVGFGVRLLTKDVDVVYDQGSPLLDRAVEIFGRGPPRPTVMVSTWRPSHPAGRPYPSATDIDASRSLVPGVFCAQIGPRFTILRSPSCRGFTPATFTETFESRTKPSVIRSAKPAGVAVKLSVSRISN